MDLPCGISNETYGDDMAIVRTHFQWGLLLSFLVFMFCVPLIASNYILNLLNTMGIVLIAVLGIQILTGYCGQISLGHAAFMGIGGYISAILSVKAGWPFWACLPCAGVGAALIGLLFGLPALRVKGFYLILTTLAVQFILMYVIYIIPNQTGGADGLTVPPPELGNVVFDTKGSFYYITLTVVVIMTLLAKNIVRTRVGRSFIAIRDNDLAAEVMGVSLFRYKLLAFFIGCFFAGIAGSLWVHFTTYVHPTYFTLMDSIWFLGMIIVGGLGSISGAVFGTIFLKGLEEITLVVTPGLEALLPPEWKGAVTGSLGMILQGLVILLFLIYEPHGMSHRWGIIKSGYRLWPFSFGRGV